MNPEPHDQAPRGFPLALRKASLSILALTAALVGVILLAASSRPAQALMSAPPTPQPPQADPMLDAEQYVVIGWNDLGMHCMNESFANLAVLPPYNTLWAQVIRKGTIPQVMTSTVQVSYNILDNTYSAGKTNFWQYAKQLFGVDLPPNVGLKGATLAGDMHAQPDHFVIEGVPLTPYRDSAPQPGPANWYPYQLAHMAARDAATGQVLAETTTVAPVSTEMRCDLCHSDGQREGIRTGNVETNILTLHDQEEGTHLMAQRPVLCASCHGSNALGLTGNPNLPNLSRAMHSQHAEVTRNSQDCYNCHPGQQTQCLRDVMYSNGLTCTDCHGSITAVASASRRPWIDLPRCETCHGPQYAENPNTLFRNSVGHGGLYCEACHGSPHAILPTNQANDNLQNISLQGHAGTLNDCTVCHGTNVPAGPGPHGLTAGELPTPTATATGAATATATSTATATAEPTNTVGPSPTPKPSSTPEPTATSQPTRTPEASPTARPREEIEFTGVVESRPDGRMGEWHIGGRTVTVDRSTRFDESSGPAVVGATVKVRGYQGSNGHILAQRITLESSGGSQPTETKFIGTIQQLPSNGLIGTWHVDSTTVNVTSSTDIHGQSNRYRVGTRVKIHGLRQSNGSVTASEIDLADNDNSMTQ